MPAWWPAIEGRQLKRLHELRDRLDRFAHASAHDRRHLQTPDQVASVDEAADLLGGPSRSPGSMIAPPDARTLLVTGVYGAGKTTVAVELADRLGAAGDAVAAIDLDWLGWYEAPVAWDEHEDPRMTLRNLAALRDAYLEVGVRTFILAGAAREASAVERLRSVMRTGFEVVRLEVDADTVRARLSGDANASRADDLAVAVADLESPAPEVGARTVDGTLPTAEVATVILELLGWTAAT